MRKFECIETGAVLLVTNEFTAKQFIKSDKYREVKEEVKTKTTPDKKKAIKDFNKKELVALLQSLGLEDVNEEMKKDDLLALVPEDYEAE